MRLAGGKNGLNSRKSAEIVMQSPRFVWGHRMAPPLTMPISRTSGTFGLTFRWRNLEFRCDWGNATATPGWASMAEESLGTLPTALAGDSASSAAAESVAVAAPRRQSARSAAPRDRKLDELLLRLKGIAAADVTPRASGRTAAGRCRSHRVLAARAADAGRGQADPGRSRGDHPQAVGRGSEASRASNLRPIEAAVSDHRESADPIEIGAVDRSSRRGRR